MHSIFDEEETIDKPMPSAVFRIDILNVESLEPNEWNPQEMDDHEFNLLVERMRDKGFHGAIQVVPKEVDGQVVEGKYIIINGEHRYRAARLLGIKSVPCNIMTGMDEEAQKIETVQDNLVKGNLNKLKFTNLVESLGGSNDELAAKMGFVDETALLKQTLVREEKAERERLSKEEKVEADSELDLINNVSVIINDIFTKYGDTVKLGFMYAFLSKKYHLVVQMDAELDSAVKSMKSTLQENDDHIAKFLKEAILEKLEKDY